MGELVVFDVDELNRSMLGTVDGSKLGAKDSSLDGTKLITDEGWLVKYADGIAEGFSDLIFEGNDDGNSLKREVGFDDGSGDWCDEGLVVDVPVGICDG